ncbi:protein apnoia [Episyrphus balteatus]|uniref:protein apnoia n=1 Tax=Episyrphus balteatus TaxID=286459 RepID=UPI00248639C3|nr:protein apnoia [Episyrphus balteatus]
MALNQRFLTALVVVCFVVNEVVCRQIAESTVNNSDSDVSEGRTFGHHFLKRISFAIVPGAFVVGVITTLLAALTVVSMKGLGVGLILLILTIGQLMSRAIPQAQASPLAAPVPVIYSHAHSQQPVFLEKEW